MLFPSECPAFTVNRP